MVYFALLWWHINYCRLFNAKSGLHTHTHTHIYIYMICKHKLTRLNSSKYCYVSLPIQHQSFVYEVKYQTTLFQAIQLRISHLFTHSLNVKQFFLTHSYDPIRCYTLGQSRHWSDWGAQHFSKLRYYRSLSIRLFNVIYRTLTGDVLPLCRDAVVIFYSPSQQGYLTITVFNYIKYNVNERWYAD